MKKAILLFLVIILSFSLISCEKDREYDEAVVKAAAEELIAKSENLNRIYWGRGIEYMEDLNYKNGSYYRANSYDTDRLGFDTISELKVITRAVFSKSYCENIFSTTLTSIFDDSGIQTYARYVQQYEDLEQKIPQYILVNSNALVLLDSDVEYLYDTLKVIGSKKQTVYVTISAEVSKNGKSQIRELKIGLVEEENGWRLDTPTYVNYYDETEEID